MTVEKKKEVTYFVVLHTYCPFDSKDTKIEIKPGFDKEQDATKYLYNRLHKYFLELMVDVNEENRANLVFQDDFEYRRDVEKCTVPLYNLKLPLYHTAAAGAVVDNTSDSDWFLEGAVIKSK